MVLYPTLRCIHQDIYNRNEKDRKKYWAIRKELDDRLVALLKSIEDRWVGRSKILLLGQLKDAKDNALVDKVMKEHCPKTLTEGRKQRLRTILSGACYLSKDELEASLTNVLDTPTISSSMLSACSKLTKLKEASRHPVIFILDPRIQSLPWESLPCLAACKQPASRVTSLSFLHTLWQVMSILHDLVLGTDSILRHPVMTLAFRPMLRTVQVW